MSIAIKPSHVFKNYDEFQEIWKDLEAAIQKLQSFKPQILNKEEPMLKEGQYLALVVVDKDSPSPENSIHDFLLADSQD